MFDLSSQGIAKAVLRVIVLLLSLCVHEFAHAAMAWRLGDDTAAREGRLSLNPLVHADFFGTILLPLLGAPIGWAKPVPFNPSRFGRGISMSLGTVLVKSAGPMANVVLALLAAVAYGLLQRFGPQFVARGTPGAALILSLLVTNAGLAVFNLLPIEPLDGAAIVDHFIPRAARAVWESIRAMGPWILLGLIVLSQVSGFLDGPVYALAGALLHLGTFITGA